MRKNTFFRKVLVLVGGTAFAQFFPIIITPILTRIYSPAEFGLWAVLIALSSPLTVAACGRYELAIVPARKLIEANGYILISFTFCAVISIFLTLIVTYFGRSIADFFNISQSYLYLFFIPLIVFLSGCNLILRNSLLRNDKIKALSISTVLRSFSTGVFNIVFGLLLQSTLILGTTVGLVFCNVFLLLDKTFKKVFRKKALPKSYLYYLLRKKKSLVLISAPAAMLNSFGSQLNILIISHLYNEIITGIYSLTTRIVFLPITMVSRNVSQVFFKECDTYLKESRDLKPLLQKTMLILFLMACPIVLLLHFFGAVMFEFIFGSEWRVAGEYAQIIALVFLLRFVISPLSPVFIIMDKVAVGARWQVSYFFTSLITLTVASTFLVVKDMLWVFVFHELILYTIYLYLILNVTFERCKKKNV